MTCPRVRNDRFGTVYFVENSLLGVPGELELAQGSMGKLSLFIRQAANLFCVEVMSFEVHETGYSLVCAAAPDLPSEEELRKHYIARYGEQRAVPDFWDEDIYLHWAERLRDFSRMIQNIQQRFTQWYNRKVMNGKRKGTIWKSRFKSRILETARNVTEKIKGLFSFPVKGKGLWKQKGGRWRKSNRGFRFLKHTVLPVAVSTIDFTLLIICVLLEPHRGAPRLPLPLVMIRELAKQRVKKVF